MSITLARSAHNLVGERTMYKYLQLIAFVMCSASLLMACDDPCYELSKRICFCEGGELAQQACIDRLDLQESNGTPSESEQDTCQQLLDGACSEEAVCQLIEEDPAACGLALSDDNG